MLLPYFYREDLATTAANFVSYISQIFLQCHCETFIDFALKVIDHTKEICIHRLFYRQ